MADLLELDESAAQEHFFEAGWTDGLPVVPPTPDRVLDTLLAGGVTDPDEILGSVPQRNVTVTAEQLAINAVMAGCKPAYFPVVLAATDCLLSPDFNAHTACTSTGGAALCVVVSGPLAAELGMNGGLNALGPGNRANATIGRAVRLLAANVLGAKSGELDGSSMGHPGKYTLCVAEEPTPGWELHAVAIGYGPEDTTVTLMPTEGPHQVANHLNGDPEGILLTFAAAMSNPATFSTGKAGQGIVVLGWEHRTILAKAGWDRSRVQAFLAEHTRVTPDELAAGGVLLEEGTSHPMIPGPDGKLPSFRSPEDILVTTAGGAGAGWSAYIPSWAPPGHAHAEAVTRRVRLAGEALPDCGPDGCEVDLDVPVAPEEGP
ncbi:hypothetical protein [Euzebya tangerina]|uniref:hypothetical protein n=1 Tax=Euzebya tangerina TaxID=591198 RepID=UPI000E30CEA3|nr:hypothetical protein [Euzebya tangerina]